MKKLFFWLFLILFFLILTPVNVQAVVWCSTTSPGGTACTSSFYSDCGVGGGSCSYAESWNPGGNCYNWSCDASCPNSPHPACTVSCLACPDANPKSCPMIPTPSPACSWNSGDVTGACNGSQWCYEAPQSPMQCAPNQKIHWTFNQGVPASCGTYRSNCHCVYDRECVSPTPTPTNTPRLTPTPTLTPTLTPTPRILACNESCTTAGPSCARGLVCHAVWFDTAYCRNPNCPDSQNCVCVTPTPTVRLTVTPRPERCLSLQGGPLDHLKIGDEVDFSIVYTSYGAFEDIAFRIFKDGQILETRFMTTYPNPNEIAKFRIVDPGRYSFAAYVKSGGVWR